MIRIVFEQFFIMDVHKKSGFQQKKVPTHFWEQDVGGSNPFTPTKIAVQSAQKPQKLVSLRLFIFIFHLRNVVILNYLLRSTVFPNSQLLTLTCKMKFKADSPDAVYL